tara:strand:+ start:1077 stop:1424 length:348 start_codon:yes stop_codon:yes gene_type:complete
MAIDEMNEIMENFEDQSNEHVTEGHDGNDNSNKPEEETQEGGRRRRRSTRRLRRSRSRARSRSSRSSKAPRKGKKSRKRKGASKWIAHVKAYCKKHNMKFNEALKSKDCKKAYKN